jgi:hypothetical protein
MKKEYTTEELYDEAMKMYASGYDNVYIELQFAEQGATKDAIKDVVNRIKQARKREQRAKGVKLMIGGAATVAVGILFTLISFNSESPVGYVLYGVIVLGFMSFAKGLVDMF